MKDKFKDYKNIFKHDKINDKMLVNYDLKVFLRNIRYCLIGRLNLVFEKYLQK